MEVDDVEYIDEALADVYEVMHSRPGPTLVPVAWRQAGGPRCQLCMSPGYLTQAVITKIS